MTGRCLTRTGQPLQAIAILRGALDQFDATQARDKALYMSWLAEAYLDAGEIDVPRYFRAVARLIHSR
jgi:hypothetical protein